MTNTVVVPSFVVTQTYLVASRRDGQYYELHLASDQGEDASRVLLITRDDALYRRALAMEGSTERVRISAHFARLGNGRRVRVLDGLEAA